MCPVVEVLEAIHNRTFQTHPYYKETADHGPFELQVDIWVKSETFSLDEHHADVMEVGPGHVEFARYSLFLLCAC